MHRKGSHLPDIIFEGLSPFLHKAFPLLAEPLLFRKLAGAVGEKLLDLLVKLVELLVALVHIPFFLSYPDVDLAGNKGDGEREDKMRRGGGENPGLGDPNGASALSLLFLQLALLSFYPTSKRLFRRRQPCGVASYC